MNNTGVKAIIKQGVLAWSGNVYFGLQYVVSCRVHRVQCELQHGCEFELRHLYRSGDKVLKTRWLTRNTARQRAARWRWTLSWNNKSATC